MDFSAKNNNVFSKYFQVNTSTQKTIEDIDNVFDLFTSVLIDALHKRRNVLKTEALRFQEDCLMPLKACHELIAGKLQVTQLYIEEGRTILRVGGPTSVEETLRFSEKASQLGRLVKLKAKVLNPTPCHIL
jgi:hypothetical protein